MGANLDFITDTPVQFMIKIGFVIGMALLIFLLEVLNAKNHNVDYSRVC